MTLSEESAVVPTIVEAFDEDLAWARATLPGMSDYPVPDALPFAGRKLVLHEWTLWSEWEQVLAECHRRLVDGGDFATRFVAVTWAYRIWASRTDPDEEDSNFGPDFDPEEWEIKESCERLTDLVGLRRPDETGDAQESAWELVCRCAIQDWEGARAFLERFVTQTSISPRDARALRGQLGAVIALVIENPDVLHVSLSWWKPRLDSGLMDGPFPSDDGDYEQPSQMAWLRPSMLLGWGLKPDPLPPNEDLRLTIADAAHELAQANSLEKLPAHYRAFLARAFVNSGRRQEGAALYRGIVDEEPWVSLGEATWDLRRGIAEALVAAGDSQRAGALMEDLLREHQDTRLSLRLARLYIESECDHRKAYELLERAVKADPSLGSQPAIDIGLTLGRLGVDALSPQAVRHALGANESTLSVARGLLRSLGRGFDRLSPKSQEELVDAAIALNLPDNGSLHARSRFPWAIVQSTNAVERELQVQIFAPFRAENQQTPPASDQDPIAVALRSRRAPGRGEMLQALSRPKTATQKQLQAWARIHHGTLVKWLARHDTSALSRARAKAVHATDAPAPGRDEASAVFDLTIGLLATLPG